VGDDACTPKQKENMKNKSSLVLGVCISVLVLSSSSVVRAESKATPSPSASPAASTSPAEKSSTKKTNRPVPFRGKVASVDSTANTFSIAGKGATRVIKVTDQTKVTKQGVEATMKDIVVDEEVRGSSWKKEDGSLEARTVKIGPLSADEEARRAARKQKKNEADAAASPAASPSPTAQP
jgi:hypothetical protein